MQSDVESVYGGSEGDRFASSNFRFSEACYLPHNRVPTHSHPCGMLTLLWDGGFTESGGSGDVACTPKTILYKSGEQPHSDRAGPEGAHCLLIEIPRQALDQDVELLGLQAPIALASPEALTIRSLILREFSYRDTASVLALEGLVLELLALFLRRPERHLRHHPKWLDELLAILHDSFQESFSLSQLAASVGKTPRQLAGTFRRHLGCSVGSYHRRLRVEHAARQLTATNDSLTRIALDAGFFDQAHFSRQFKKAMGLTPSQFRARAQPRDT